MATLVVHAAPGRAGITDLVGTAVAADAALTDKFTNTGVELFFINNGDASPHTLTITFQKTLDGAAPANKTVTVAAGKSALVGPFPADTYSDANGFVVFTYDAVTSVKVLPIKPV